MCGEFGEVTVIIGLVINFLAFVSPLCAFRDTSTFIFYILTAGCRDQLSITTNLRQAISFSGHPDGLRSTAISTSAHS